MGGERETTAEKKTSDKGTTKIGKFRIHENVGQVHIHDDELNLKAAVPVAEWFKAWEKLRTQPSRFEWCDTTNDTYLTIETLLTGEPPGIEAIINLTRGIYGVNFKALNEFTKRK